MISKSFYCVLIYVDVFLLDIFAIYWSSVRLSVNFLQIAVTIG